MVTQNSNAQATMIDPLQICPGNHTRLIVERKQKKKKKIEEKEESETLCLKALLPSVVHEEEKVEEKEEYETLYLNTLLKDSHSLSHTP